MELRHLHPWNVTPQEAIALQKRYAAELIEQPFEWDTLRTVGGVDTSVKGDMSQAAVVILSYPDFRVLETVKAQQPTPFPYVPGLLTFREGPALVEAFMRLQTIPDVFLFDGMGRIHPRRMGIAAHMGLWLDRPTVGCGKTPFVGKFAEPGLERGSSSDIIDRGELIGRAVRTKDKVKPVYVSPGHRMSLADSVMLVLQCVTRYRLPEPIRAAHNAAGVFQ